MVAVLVTLACIVEARDSELKMPKVVVVVGRNPMSLLDQGSEHIKQGSHRAASRSSGIAGTVGKYMLKSEVKGSLKKITNNDMLKKGIDKLKKKL